jgi:glycosyltransferase involved in cell wall biosynthesis
VKIALVSSVVPLVNGGYRNIVDWLAPELRKAGHQTETVWLPADMSPPEILSQMFNYRLLRLEDSCDRIVTFRPPAHLISHPNKIVWFIHHERAFFDLWGTPYSPYPSSPIWQSLRSKIRAADTQGLREAKAVFANSQVVHERLKRFNGVDSRVLFPPVANPERFHIENVGTELVFICRIENHKRQHLAVQAMRHTKTPVRLRICGSAGDPSYLASLQNMVRAGELQDRITLDTRWISEGEKAYLLANALAHVYLAVDEDSYGYPTLEAAHSSKATVTTTDSGGVLELVIDNETGVVADPDPLALADAFDRLWTDRAFARRLGAAANGRIGDLQISWDHVVGALTGEVLMGS